MLVLTRKPGQRIVIDGPCVIEVTQITQSRARLGIVADGTTSIVRAELLSAEPRPKVVDLKVA